MFTFVLLKVEINYLHLVKSNYLIFKYLPRYAIPSYSWPFLFQNPFHLILLNSSMIGLQFAINKSTSCCSEYRPFMIS